MNAVVQVESRYDAEPAQAIAAIAAHDGPVFVDLDETLYLRNSTEDFIDLARPGLLALLMLRFFDIVKPWRWTGGEPTRDVWRVRLICMVFPWTRRRWNAHVTGLARNFSNLHLLDVLRTRRNATIIITVGFEPIVTPLIAALGLPDVRVIAPRLNSFEDRRRGKLQSAIDAIGEDVVRRGLLITDSLQDLALLEACARPLRTVWPEARYRRALSHVYLPGQYLTQVKRPGEHYIRRAILQEDFAFWLLCSIGLSPNPILHVPALLLLLASFWTIYERGYVENDLSAARYERDPKLSAAYAEMPVATPVWQPWVWALTFGALGIALLHWPTAPTPRDMLKWFGTLVVTYLWFGLYNRLDKVTRTWMYPGLQLARAAAFTVVVPIVPIGVAALGAHTLARCVPYYIYRLSGHNWPGEARATLVRTTSFIMLALLLGVALGWSVVLNATAAVLLAWNLFRARKQLAEMLTSVSRLDRRRKKANS
jgi:hypothetical protein